MLASSLPLATTGLRRPARDGHGGGGLNEDPVNWCAWAHQGHRLWEAMPESFWVYTYKVDKCPFRGSHVWTTCPYAHKGERARRRDPSRYAYAGVTCPEYAESMRRIRQAGSSAAPTCARGLRCGYAHGIFETWLHPTRFRTVMCERGADCPRRVCFFAHRLEQRRREDAEVPLVVFPATTPPFVPLPRAPPPPLLLPASASPSSSSRSRSQSASVVDRPVDHVTQAIQEGRSVFLLTRGRYDVAGASSSSPPTSHAAVATAAAAATALVPVPPRLLQASPLPVDDDEIDFVAIVTGCCLAAEADSKAEGSGYPHLDLIMDIVRS